MCTGGRTVHAEGMDAVSGLLLQSLQERAVQGTRLRSGAPTLGTSQLGHFSDVRPQTSHFTSPHFTFITCETGIITAPAPSQGDSELRALCMNSMLSWATECTLGSDSGAGMDWGQV